MIYHSNFYIKGHMCVVSKAHTFFRNDFKIHKAFRNGFGNYNSNCVHLAALLLPILLSQ